MGTWLVFDDDTVDSIKEGDIPKYFGDSNSGSAYVLYYQALDIDLSALGLTSPSPDPVMQPVPQSEPPQHLEPTDSPVSAALSIPPLPPGLTDDSPSSPTVPEPLPRPTTPLIPIPSLPLEPPGKSPRKTSSQFFKVALGRPATIGHKPSRNDPVIRPSRSVVDEKFANPKPNLAPIAIFAKEDLKPLESHSAGAVNGKDKDSDRSMMGWLRRRSTKAGKSRPSSEVNADLPQLPQDVLAAPGSPVRNQSTGSSSNSSKDSRHPLDSPTPGHASPRVSPLPISRLPLHSQTIDTSPYETESRKSSASGGSYTTPTSPPSDRRLRPRPLPAIPASPQTPQNDTSSPFSRTSLDHGRVQRQPGKDGGLLLSPKSPARPATSAGPPTKTRTPLPSAPPKSRLQVPSPNLATGRSDSHKNTVERPKSAHASYGLVLPPPTSPLPPLPASATMPTRKPAARKLSLSAPMLGFVRRDKDKQ